jgi:hypothetical protein
MISMTLRNGRSAPPRISGLKCLALLGAIATGSCGPGPGTDRAYVECGSDAAVRPARH